MASSGAPAPDKQVTVEGKCPEPVLRCAKALRNLESGMVLRLVCSDPASVADIAAFARQTGNTLIVQDEVSDGGRTLYEHFIRRR